MASRWERVCGSNEIRYSEGLPVIVSATALLRDITNGDVAAQIMFRNISDQDIISLTVSIFPKDIDGNRIARREEKVYSGFTAHIGENFGDRSAIVFYGSSQLGIKDYDIAVSDVVYSNNSKTTFENKIMEPVPRWIELEEELGKPLASQYVKLTTEEAKYVPVRYRGLNFCTCGVIFTDKIEKCYHCKTDYARIVQIANRQKLSEEVYQEAESQISANTIDSLDTAIKLFEAIPDWKDSKTQIEKCNQMIQAKEKKRLIAKKRATIISIVVGIIIASIFGIKTFSRLKAEKQEAERVIHASSNIIDSDWQDNYVQRSVEDLCDYDLDLRLSFDNEKTCIYSVAGTCTYTGSDGAVKDFNDYGVAPCEFIINDEQSIITIRAISNGSDRTRRGYQLFLLTAKYDILGDITDFGGAYYFWDEGERLRCAKLKLSEQ